VTGRVVRHPRAPGWAQAEEQNVTTCRSCGHDYNDHGRHGGDCSHVTYTEERIEPDHPADGIEIRQDWAACECLYFVGAFIPATP
jgi:hypothetical protein